MTDMHLDYISIAKKLCDEMDCSKSTVSYILNRCRNEGIKFLTVTLPKLSRAVLSALNTGSLDRSTLTAFRWKGKSLAVFREFLDLIVNPVDGRLISQPCPIAIYRLRQLCEYMYKLALDDTLARRDTLVEEFVKLDSSLTWWAYDIDFLELMRKNLETFYRFPTVATVLSSHRPRVGPGTFSSDTRSNLPYYAVKLSSEMNTVPRAMKAISGFFKPYPSTPVTKTYLDDELGDMVTSKRVMTFGSDTSDVSELLFVPKDSRGPRTIVREPLHRLRVQMSFFDWFSSYLQGETKGRVNFTDQSVNQKLARLGSINGSYATIDLKDASDSVNYHMVKKLCRYVPTLTYFLKFRSTHVDLGKGKLHKLNKLAGMGSGLTFAWLAFLSHLSIATMIARRTGKTYVQASKLVYVYGDDIVVPASYAIMAREALSLIGLKVNTDKSYDKLHLGRKSYFRESCGGDYFGGNDVGIVRAKFPSANPEVIGKNLVLYGAAGLIQLNAHCKELVSNGMLGLADFYYSMIEKYHGELPIITNFKSSVIGRYSRKWEPPQEDSFGNSLTTRALVSVPVEESYELDDYWVLKSALQGCNVADPLAYLDCDTGRTTDNIVVPRAHKISRKRVLISDLRA